MDQDKERARVGRVGRESLGERGDAFQADRRKAGGEAPPEITRPGTALSDAKDEIRKYNCFAGFDGRKELRRSHVSLKSQTLKIGAEGPAKIAALKCEFDRGLEKAKLVAGIVALTVKTEAIDGT